MLRLAWLSEGDVAKRRSAFNQTVILSKFENQDFENDEDGTA